MADLSKAELRHQVLKVKDSYMKEAFNLIAKLGSTTYESTHDQLKDMLKIGQLATKADSLWAATEHI